MSKDISTIKYDKVINLDGFIINPRFLMSTSIRIERIKDDPGAAYISIGTSGGMIAIFRYAYEGEALKNMTKDFVNAGYKLKTAIDEVKIAVGNYKHDDSCEDGTNALLNDIFSVLMTSTNPITPHTGDGFMLLVRNQRRCGSAKTAPEQDEDYGEDIRIECLNIRKKDEAIVSLISAINLWGNRVGVEFNTYFYDSTGRMKASAAREIYSNVGICEMFIKMDKIQMGKAALDRISVQLSELLMPIGSNIPRWMAFGGQAQVDKKTHKVMRCTDHDEAYDYDF